MQKPNFELKAQLLGTDYAYFKTYRLVERSLRSMKNSFPGQLSSSECSEIISRELKLNPEKWKECRRLSDSYRMRSKRLTHQISDMLNYAPCIFGTLTFDDKALNSTSAKHRRKVVREYLKSQTGIYIANIDFGAKNHREHYHFIGVGEKSAFNKKLWKYGFTCFKPVYTLNPLKLAKYIAKLKNHAIKETTQNNSLIYSDLKAPISDYLTQSSKSSTLLAEFKELQAQRHVLEQAQCQFIAPKQLSFFETEKDGNLPY